MLKFKSSLLKTDVICVKIYNDHVLAGIGNYVHIYDLPHLCLIERVEIFKGTKICGFYLNNAEDKLLIHGETEIKIISFGIKSQNFFEMSNCPNKNDWILAAKWIENDTRIVTVSMNNTATLWDLEFNDLSTILCEERCIAYSAYIVYNKWEDIVLLSGTVFSEVLIWRPSEIKGLTCPVRRIEGHKGVIFSVSYNEYNNLICTTSDDRTTIVWKVTFNDLLENCIYNADFEQLHVLYGHTARVFNCKQTENFILTAGEDGIVNIWNLDGSLFRKIDAHQGVNVWTVDCREDVNLIVTGGADCALNTFSLKMEITEKKIKFPKSQEKIKKIALLRQENILIMTESGNFYCYNKDLEEFLFIDHIKCMENYSLLEVSPDKTIVAIAGFRGDIFIYRKATKTKKILFRLCSHKIPHEPRIFSMHFLSQSKNKLLTCTNKGFMFIYEIRGELVLKDIKQLPPSKERFTTCALALDNDIFAVGDRNGNIYLYGNENVGPIFYLKRAHSFMGVTNLYYECNAIISIGKDSMIKKYNFDRSKQELHLLSTDKLPFAWLTRYFNHIDAISGFMGENIVIFNYRNRRFFSEIACGGGHRCFDISDNYVSFFIVYVKDNFLHTIKIPTNDLMRSHIESAYHSKEINSLASITDENDSFLISGGEDTIFKIHRFFNPTYVEEMFVSKSHLSSIRTICCCPVDDKNYFLFSGGGRAQIIFWHLKVNNFCGKCIEKDVYYERLEENLAENRIMDIFAYKYCQFVFMFAACSDGNVKVFKIALTQSKLIFLGNIMYSLRCILKITILKCLETLYSITMATDGLLVFWNVNIIFTDENAKIESIKPLQSFKIHQSGVNSYSYTFLTENKIAFASGGDDNLISLIVLQFEDVDKISKLVSLSNSKQHCAQITGVFIDKDILITTSIDQKVIAYRWDSGSFNVIATYYSAIADIQGIKIFGKNRNDENLEETSVELAVYGKGLEILTLS